MSTPEESPAQRAARQRRERREAKIKEGGSARLDKITSLSGRTPQSAREETSPSPQPALSPSPSPAPRNFRSSQASQLDTSSLDALQAQQETFRAMLRQAVPEQSQGPSADDAEDPTIKLLNSFLNVMPGDPNAPTPPPGTTGGASGMPGMSPAAIASALGVPPFIADMFGGVSQPTEQEQRTSQRWKTLHVLFALGVATYLLLLIGTSVTLFGSPPPKPATVQNPFLIFVTGEILLTSGRILMNGGAGGLKMAVKVGKDIVRDGSLVIFILGLGSWYYREWQATNY